MGGVSGAIARVDDVVGPGAVARHAPLGQLVDTVAGGDGATLVSELIELAVEHHNLTVLVQQRVVFVARDHAAAGGKHQAAALGDVGQRRRLPLAEGRLAVLDDKVGARHAQTLLEGAVQVDVLAAGEQGDLLTHAGFARARHADKCDVLLAVGQARRHVQDALARGNLAGIALDSLCRLGHKHEQTADAGDAATFSLEHESRAGGVVDDIDDALERVEALERARRVGAVGEHTGRRAVDEQCGVGLLCDVVVVDLACASHGHDDRAQVAQHHTCRGAGTAGGAEHEGLLAGNLYAQLLDQALKTKVVGVVAAQTAIGQTRDGVDVAHAFGERAQLVQVVHDGALVGNGHVGALPLIARYKGGEVFGLALKTHVLKPPELLVDGRGVAVAQHAAQHAVGAGCGDVSHLEHLRVAAKVGEALAHVIDGIE